MQIEPVHASIFNNSDSEECPFGGREWAEGFSSTEVTDGRSGLR